MRSHGRCGAVEKQAELDLLVRGSTLLVMAALLAWCLAASDDINNKPVHDWVGEQNKENRKCRTKKSNARPLTCSCR